MISPQTIKEFQLILEEEYGVEMDDAKASETLRQVVGYFRLLNRLSVQIESPQKPQN